MWFDLLDTRNGLDADCDRRPVKRTLIVASTPRCGSTMLCRTLWDSGRIGAPKEYFNPTQQRDWGLRFARSLPIRAAYGSLRGPTTALLARLPWSDRRLRAYVRVLQDHRTGSDGWFAMKIHWHHFQRIFVRTEREPSSFFGPVSWVHMTRGDRVAQAVSWARALQTGRWSARQAEKRRPMYSRPLIDRTLRWIEEGEAGWDDWFVRHGVEPVRLTYEAYTSDHALQTARVLQELGVSLDPNGVPTPPTRIQRDETNLRWRERYLSST